jgi:hypothetical protein
MSPVVRLSRVLLVVAAGSALVFCRPPPKDTKKPDTSNPDTEFSDGEEFSAANSSSSSSSSSSSDKSSGSGESLPYEACRDKKCGTPCTICDPNDDSCPELQLIHQCSLTGQCLVAPVDCTPPEPEKGKDGKAKGKDDSKKK